MTIGSSSSSSSSRSSTSTSRSTSSPGTQRSTTVGSTDPRPSRTTQTTTQGRYYADALERGGKLEVGTKTVDLRRSPPANGPWSKDEFEAGTKTTTEAKGSVRLTDDTVSAKLSGGFSQEVTNAKGYGVSFGVNTAASVVASQKTENGVTTFEVKTDASITVSGGVSAPKAGLAVAHAEGLKVDYAVAMPEAAAKAVDPKTVNPFDPGSMPTGTVVTLDGAKYASTEFKASFKELAVATKVTDATGVSVAVEKTGPSTVRVTAGPTRAIEAYNGVGVDLGAASVMLGRDDSLGAATLKTAEFDLATPEGRAAYNDVLTSGTIPSKSGVGVSNVATIEKLDFSSQTKLDAKLGPFELSLGGNKNVGASVVTTLPDGTSTVSQDLAYGGNTPLHVDRQFDAAGRERLSERRYSYTLVADAGSAMLLNSALSGRLNTPGALKAGQTVTLTFTQDQMRAYMEQTQKAAAASVGFDPLKMLVNDYDGKAVNDPEAFALALARNQGGSDAAQAERMFNIALGGDGDFGDRKLVAIDATVSVR